jgi:hypothetical protein
MSNERKIKKVVSAAIQLKKKKGKWYEKWKKRTIPWLEQIKRREGNLYEIWKEQYQLGIERWKKSKQKLQNKGRN